MLIPHRPASGRVPVLVGWGVGLACFAYLLALPPSLNPADESFLLYGAKRVLHGDALYRDFFDFQTPGSFYLYALAYAVGGTSITSARVTTALLNAISAVCTYFLALHVASMAEAVLAGLLVVTICVPMWNAASHHWLATTLGLATATVLLADRWRDSSRRRPAAAGALAGLSLCSQQSRSLWLLLWLVLTVPALALVRGRAGGWRRCLRELVWTAIGGVAVCLPLLGFAVWRSSLGEMIYATYTWPVTNYRDYNVGKFIWASALFPGLLVYSWYWLFLAIPKILAIESIAVLWALWRFGLRDGVVRAALLLLALATVGSILYFPDVIHIAFVAPFSLVVLAGMAYRVRTAFLVPRAWWAVGALRLAWSALLAVVIAKAVSNARLIWREHPVLYSTAFGTLAGTEVHADTVRDLRAHLRVDGGVPPRLFAYPHDAWLYLALPADNPTPFSLMRPKLYTPEQMQTTTDRLRGDPQALVLVNLLFVAPDDPFMTFLNEHYRDVGGIGPPVIFGGWPLYRLFAPVAKD